MNKIVFYEKANGTSELWDYLEGLRIASATNKDARIQYNQILLSIQLLEENGTNLPAGITKHLGNGLWELRPGKNRILYFFYEDNTYILLHSFRKKTQRTPKGEIEKAKKERMDYLNRKEHDHENLE